MEEALTGGRAAKVEAGWLVCVRGVGLGHFFSMLLPLQACVCAYIVTAIAN